MMAAVRIYCIVAVAVAIGDPSHVAAIGHGDRHDEAAWCDKMAEWRNEEHVGKTGEEGLVRCSGEGAK